jgi:alpha-ketoglutarate-dependent 2,4-dichlorophenoxyacetate dioxygenase
MHVRQLHPLFAAEITGLDTAGEVTPETIEAVERAMAQHAVCVIRDASLNDADHIRFSRAFGPLELPPGGRGRIAPQLYDISNLDAKGEIIPFDPEAKAQPIDFERFHTDSPFNSLPTKWSLLLGYVVPPEGAETLFVDTRAVYDDLSPQMQQRIADLVAEHDMFRALERTGVKFGDDAMRKAFPTMPHPLVRESASGRKALYLGWHAVGIVGWPEPEAQALLDELFQFAIQDRYVYSHTWRQGDMLIWDNRCTMHSATSFERYRYRRDCRRTTINEYGPERSAIEGMGAPPRP